MKGLLFSFKTENNWRYASVSCWPWCIFFSLASHTNILWHPKSVKRAFADVAHFTTRVSTPLLVVTDILKNIFIYLVRNNIKTLKKGDVPCCRRCGINYYVSTIIGRKNIWFLQVEIIAQLLEHLVGKWKVWRSNPGCRGNLFASFPVCLSFCYSLVLLFELRC